ncbi:unnamed protein product [Lasius platythorax]|uniref:Uncharacterized protein n=1 Tax=Lasius platythorax TaxID=488582 RepID=A0AAV2P3K8_9HYME
MQSIFFDLRHGRSVYTEARDNYRVPGTAGWHYKLVPVREVPGQCGLTEKPHFGVATSTAKKMRRAKRTAREQEDERGGGGRVGRRRGKNKYGARTVNLGCSGPPQRKDRGPEEQPRREIVSGD